MYNCDVYPIVPLSVNAKLYRIEYLHQKSQVIRCRRCESRRAQVNGINTVQYTVFI